MDKEMCCEREEASKAMAKLDAAGQSSSSGYTLGSSITAQSKLVSIMEQGIQLRQEIHSIREQFKGILDVPVHSNLSPRAQFFTTPRTPLQPISSRSFTPVGTATPISRHRPRPPKMGIGMGSAESTTNALTALQNYLRNRTPTKRKLIIGEEDNKGSASKLARKSPFGTEDKENDKPTNCNSRRKNSIHKRLSVNSRDSLKKILLSPKRRKPKVLKSVNRSPILTNGILIRNKEGELLNPPSCNKHAEQKSNKITKVRRRLNVNNQTELARSPYTMSSLGKRTSADGRVDPHGHSKTNYTAELSDAHYSQSPETFYVMNALSDKSGDHFVDSRDMVQPTPVANINTHIHNAVRNIIPDKSNISSFKSVLQDKTASDKTLADMSAITKSAEVTIREQPSAMMDMSSNDVLHSTLNYPLHSTMALDPHLPAAIRSLNESNTSCDSSTLSFCVDGNLSSSLLSKGNCDVCKLLKRQVGHGHLQQPQHPVSLSESDLLFDRSDCNTSLDATRASIANHSDLTHVGGDSESTICDITTEQSTVTDQTIISMKSKSRTNTNRSRRNHRKHERTDENKENIASCSATSYHNLSHQQKKDLKKKMKNYNSSALVNDNSKIMTLGFF